MNHERIKEAIIRLARDGNLDPKTRHDMLFDIGCVCDEECTYLENEYDVEAIPDEPWDLDDTVELSDGFDGGYLPYNDWEP